MDKTLYTPTQEQIWAVLAPINVNDYTQKKNNLTFLSWTWAWKIMKTHFPQIQVHWHKIITYPDSDVIVQYKPEVIKERGTTAMVHCDVSIDDNTHYAWLPVMDARMNSAINPSSRDIGDSMMRCMVKGFAFFGLGHYIYAGEDIPADKESVEDLLIIDLQKTVVRMFKAGYEFSEEAQQEVRDVIASRSATNITSLQERLKANASAILVGDSR